VIKDEWGELRASFNFTPEEEAVLAIEMALIDAEIEAREENDLTHYRANRIAQQDN
jgi:hypothetical protein